MRKPSIRCICTKCERPQMVPISNLIAGAKCQLRSLSKPPCEGDLNYYTTDYNDAATNTNSLLCWFATEFKFDNQKLAELVDTVADDIGHWLEGPGDPIADGWVDCRGRP